MDDKNFEARVFDTVKNNLFAFKKMLLGLDDCVAKTDFDATNKSLQEARATVDELQRKISALVGERDGLQKTLSQREISLQRATEKISELTTELDEKSARLVSCQRKISALSTELDDKTARLDEFNANYCELEKAFDAYKKLSANTKFALEGVFGAEKTPTNFLAGILQVGHLEALFDYVATAFNSATNPAEHYTLRDLCDFAFDAVNNGRREKIFARLDVRTGEIFDNATMRKTSDSAQSGTVKKILLVGYKYIRTGKAVRPSLVTLG